MNRMRVVVGVGLLGIVGLNGCQTKDQELRTYLGDTGDLYKWETKISKAVCNLESKTGTTTGDVYCGTKPWPPSDTPPPKYPPR